MANTKALSQVTGGTDEVGGDVPNERAILAGGCFWGMQELVQPPARRRLDAGRLLAAATSRTPRIATTAPTRSRSRSCSTRRRRLPRPARVLLPDPRPDDAEPPGQRQRHKLQLGDFLHERGAARVAEDTIADVEASGLWPGKVVTELSPAGDFWEAEPEHQDYLERTRTATPATSSARSGSCGSNSCQALVCLAWDDV